MSLLFPACAAVLNEEMRPMHYAELAEKGLARLGGKKEDVDWLRVKEDVREKLLLAGQHGTAYVPRPYCLAVMVDWFPLPQLTINARVEEFRIPLRSDVCLEAMKDALLRFDYMETKTFGARRHQKLFRETGAVLPRLERRVEALVRGKLVEHHVAWWFRNRWPEAYREPENKGDYTKECPHDFALEFGGRRFEFDVAGPNVNGTFGAPRGGGKRAVDFHVLASPREGHIAIHGFERGVRFAERIFKEQSLPFVWLVVYLNCLRESLPYAELARLLVVRKRA
jgi:hypothetical protein